MSNNTYSLKFTPKAQDDLDEIYIYISSKLFTEIAAEKLLDNIENSIMRLAQFLTIIKEWKNQVSLKSFNCFRFGNG